MTVWYTSDLHIGHASLAKYRAVENGGEVANATFWHDARLAHNWDSVVKPDDSVWVTGDLSMQGTHPTNNALDWLRRRPGRKRLVPGNHDNVHPGINRDFAKWVKPYHEVFEVVVPFARKRIAGQSVLLSHFPYQGAGDHTLEERCTQWRLPDMGEWLLHGHIHSREKITGPKSIHIGLDAWDLKLVPQEAIEEMINES